MPALGFLNLLRFVVIMAQYPLPIFVVLIKLRPRECIGAPVLLVIMRDFLPDVRMANKTKKLAINKESFLYPNLLRLVLINPSQGEFGKNRFF